MDLRLKGMLIHSLVTNNKTTLHMHPLNLVKEQSLTQKMVETMIPSL